MLVMSAFATTRLPRCRMKLGLPYLIIVPSCFGGFNTGGRARTALAWPDHRPPNPSEVVAPADGARDLRRGAAMHRRALAARAGAVVVNRGPARTGDRHRRHRRRTRRDLAPRLPGHPGATATRHADPPGLRRAAAPRRADRASRPSPAGHRDIRPALPAGLPDREDAIGRSLPGRRR